MSSHSTTPIGVFDSGFGGLAVLRDLVKALPQNDFLYLGDNARSPYGIRSFETIYQYTLEAVQTLFDKGCPLVILACNTASARALRTIQQNDLPKMDPEKRVLGIIRPTTERIQEFTQNGNIGILGTSGTVDSGSYLLEIQKFFPKLKVEQLACPMWVPLVENQEISNSGARYFIKRDLAKLFEKNPSIDSILLACTHYPLLLPLIEQFIPNRVKVISQGPIVAKSLLQYLQNHPEMKQRLSTSPQGSLRFLSTDSPANFDQKGSFFFGKAIHSEQIKIGKN